MLFPGAVTAQLHLEVSPYLWLDSASVKTAGYTPTIQELYDWYDRPAFANLYLDLHNPHFKFFMEVDLRSDLKADLDHFTWTNLPVPAGGNIYIDPNYPQVGYGEYRSDVFNLSVGRRKVDWGPGHYDLGFSDRAPYFDNLAFDFKYPEKKGTWKYNFIVTTTDTRATETITEEVPGYKTFLAHKISYFMPSLIIAVTDYNLIYGRVPDLQELAPFIHYHGLYQKGQNVALGISVDSLVNQDFRLYGELFIDDFKTSIESVNSNPGAMGAIFGLQYQFFSGRPFVLPLENAARHTLKDSDFSLHGGLVLRWENVWTSEYLYNREDPLGQMTNPFYYMWEYKPKIVNTYFGAAYGPDMLIERLSLTLDNSPARIEGVFEYHMKGGHGINGPYTPPFDNWLTFGNPITHQFRLALNGTWEYNKDKVIFGDFKIDFGKTFRIQGGLGWGMKLF